MDPVPAARRPRTLAFDLTALAIVGVLLIAAVGAAALALAQQFYSPRAFVERYLALLAEGHAADALALPGVRGLVVGRTLLYPPDGDVAAAVDVAAGLVHTGTAGVTHEEATTLEGSNA